MHHHLRSLTGQKVPGNTKSVLSVLTQGVNQGHQIEVTAEGASAQEALAALQALVESDFGEHE